MKVHLGSDSPLGCPEETQGRSLRTDIDRETLPSIEGEGGSGQLQQGLSWRLNTTGLEKTWVAGQETQLPVRGVSEGLFLLRGIPTLSQRKSQELTQRDYSWLEGPAVGGVR